MLVGSWTYHSLMVAAFQVLRNFAVFFELKNYIIMLLGTQSLLSYSKSLNHIVSRVMVSRLCELVQAIRRVYHLPKET